MRTHATLAVLTALTAMIPAVVRTEPANSSPPPITSDHPELRAALERIDRGSASWRTAMAAVAATGRRVVVLTPDQVVVRNARTNDLTAFDPSAVAEATPVADDRGQVSAVLVVVNVAVMQELHDRHRSLPGEFYADIDRVLAHEVYGHAVPYLIAGHVSGRCPDPEPGTPALSSCAIQRENVIRAELRLGRRTDHSLSSLGLARLSRY
jgi:hypothetical protein